MKKKLSIAIPTYNGAATIGDALASIMSNINAEYSEKIEILISDNNSTDSCLHVVKKYSDLYDGRLRVVVNDKYESGLDGNLQNIMSRAEGDYVWFLSDDDALDSKAVEKVIKVIDKFAPDVIMVNYSECDVDLNPMPRRIREDIDFDSYCQNGDDFMVNSKMLFGLVSSLIFKKKKWLESAVENYVGLGSLHVAGVVEIMSEGRGFVVADKLVRLRIGSSRWGANGTFVYPIYNIVKILKKTSELNYDKSTYKHLLRYFYIGNWRMILKAKISGLSDVRKLLLNGYECYGGFKMYWVRDIWLSIIPHSMVKFVYYKLKSLGFKFV